MNKILLIIGYIIINNGDAKLIESNIDLISKCIKGDK